MKAIDLIRWSLQMTDEAFRALVWDMSDASLTQPTPGTGGNHPLWCVGHQAYLEAGIPRILFGADHPLEHWAPLFAAGTQPVVDAGAYPPFDEVLSTYRQVRAATIKLLEEIGESALDRKPQQIPPGFENMMQTYGQTIMLITLHQMVHYGQIADARRVAGRKPLI